MFWVGSSGVDCMNCKCKSTLKVSSNIIGKGEAYGVYIPVDLMKDYTDDGINNIDYCSLTARQKRQSRKNQFWAGEIRESKGRFSGRKENADLCKNCEYRDICY